MSTRRTAGVVAGVLSVGAVAAAVTVFNLPAASSTPSSSSDTPEKTATVTKETLVDRESHDGTLGHGETTTIAARSGGTVTRLPPTGTTLSRGKPLYRIDNRPVILLYGSLPAYRTLRSGVAGSDVKQFEKNLWALGYRGFTVDRTYSSATASAVEEWQEDVGLSETGTVSVDQIVYAGSQVRVDSQSVEPGAVVQPGSELLKVTGTSMVATVDLDVDAQRLARKGAGVTVTLPDGATAPGRITDVEAVVEPGEGPEEDVTKIRTTVAFTKASTGLDGAGVTVAFTAGERKDVLTVPVAALLALAEGGYGLQVVENGTTRIVAARTGMFADGKVQVTGPDVKDGVVVGMPG